MGHQILATTPGETGGDAITMSMLHADRNANNGGYLIGAGIFLAVFVAAVIAQVAVKWFKFWVYWIAIVASTTVGTAMADFFDRSLGIGYSGGSAILFGCVAASLAAWYLTLGSMDVDLPRLLFWAAFILTRPLDATVGDFLDNPQHLDGLGLSRDYASAVLLAVIVALIVALPQRARRHPRGVISAADDKAMGNACGGHTLSRCCKARRRSNASKVSCALDC